MTKTAVLTDNSGRLIELTTMAKINVDIEPIEIIGNAEAAELLKEYISLYKIYTINPVRLISCKNGHAVGPHFLVIDDAKIMTGSYRGIKGVTRSPVLIPTGNQTFRISENATSRTFDTEVIVLSGKAYAQFFHWVVEIIPRMQFLKETNRNNQCPLLIRPIFYSYQKQTLDLMEMDYIEVHEDVVQAPIISFATHVVRANGRGMMSPEIVSLSRRFASQITSPSLQKKRIYISRGDAPKRRVTNETDVINLLNKYGFVSVQLSSLKFRDQIELLRNSEVVIAPHGAGLASIVYCETNTKILEFYAEKFIAVSPFGNIAKLGNLDYKMLLCEAHVDGKNAYHNGDMTVDIVLLKYTLDFWLK